MRRAGRVCSSLGKELGLFLDSNEKAVRDDLVCVAVLKLALWKQQWEWD